MKARGRPAKNMIKNGKCRFFKKGKDGFCIYYAGSKKEITACYSKCFKRAVIE